MKITLESTSEVTMLVRPGAPDDSAIPARVWQGQTESGIAVQCLITRIAVLKTDDSAQFDAESRSRRRSRANARSRCG